MSLFVKILLKFIFLLFVIKYFKCEEAIPHSAPYVISIQGYFNGLYTHFYGGVLLNNEWILTTGDLEGIGIMDVVAGAHNGYISEENSQRASIDEYIVHPKYDGIDGLYNIALIRSHGQFYLNEFVKPIKLPKIRSIPKGYAINYGWGAIDNDVYPLFLQKRNLTIIDHSICVQQLYTSNITQTNLCVESNEGLVHTCTKDKGSPLIQYDSNGEEILIGISSWGGNPCGQINFPGIYSRVSAHIDWILNTTGINIDPPVDNSTMIPENNSTTTLDYNTTILF